MCISSINSPGSVFQVPVVLASDTGSWSTIALVDTGASHSFLDARLAIQHAVQTERLSTPRILRVIDGRPISSGTVNHKSSVTLHISKHSSPQELFITKLDRFPVVLGLDFLQLHCPNLDFTNLSVSFSSSYCRQHCLTTGNEGTSIPAMSVSHIELCNAVEFEQDLLDGESVAGLVHVCLSGQEDLRVHSALDTGTNDLDTMSEVINPLDLDQEEDPAHLAKVKEKVPVQYHDLLQAFSQAKANQLPPHRPFDHPIDLIEGSTPPVGRLYPLSAPELEFLSKWLKENLDKGFIRPSKSSFGAPILFVKKKNGSLRLCMDYRALNSITVKNRLALPLISDTLDRLSKATIFTKLDLKGAYNLLRIRDGDEYKTAFRTRYGLFESLVMPFGLTNAPATFQHLMTELFRDLVDVTVLIFMDDILIFSSDPAHHVDHVREVLKRLINNNLYVAIDKCEFSVTTTEYLGFIISPDGVCMSPEKVAAILEWPTPSNVKQLQSFLGFANFYRRFIHQYSAIIQPLTNLLKKGARFTWDDSCTKAFDTLKHAFTSAPILTHFDPDLPLRLETDASDSAISGVLSQLHHDQRWHPVCFHSRKLTPPERNYTISEKELLPIVECVRIWRHYVESVETLNVYTDHANLVTLKEPRILNRRQSRWRLLLAPFRLELHYRSGKENTVADLLSRRSDLLEGGKATSEQPQPLFEPAAEHFQISAASTTTTISNTTSQNISIPDQIRQLQPKDPHYQHISSQDPMPQPYSLHNNLLMHRNRIYVPDDQKLRCEILSTAHDSPLAGHRGRDATYNRVADQFYWPGLDQFVRDFVASCDTCQRIKTRRHRPYGHLQPLPIPTRPWQSLSMDHITHLPSSHGFDALLVVVDRFSKMIKLIPAHATDTAADLAKQYQRYVFCDHGLPDDIVSDRGPTFASKFWRCLCDSLGIKTKLSTAYHPQTDGQTEIVNASVEIYLRAFVDHLQHDWVDWLPTAQFSHNSARHTSTGKSPFELVYGFNPRSDLTMPSDTVVPAATGHLTALQSAQESARRSLTFAQQRSKSYADLRRKQAPTFRVGDQVLLRRDHLPSDRPSRALDHLYLGPFSIAEIISTNAYRLNLPPAMSIHPVVNIAFLEPYKPNTLPSRQTLPPTPAPEIVDGQEHFHVSHILDSRIRRRRLEYLVHFSGFGVQDREWVPASDLSDDAPAVLEYHQEHPTRPITPARKKAIESIVQKSSKSSQHSLTEGGQGVTGQGRAGQLRRSSRLRSAEAGAQ